MRTLYNETKRIKLILIPIIISATFLNLFIAFQFLDFLNTSKNEINPYYWTNPNASIRIRQPYKGRTYKVEFEERYFDDNRFEVYTIFDESSGAKLIDIEITDMAENEEGVAPIIKEEGLFANLSEQEWEKLILSGQNINEDGQFVYPEPSEEPLRLPISEAQFIGEFLGYKSYLVSDSSESRDIFQNTLWFEKKEDRRYSNEEVTLSRILYVSKTKINDILWDKKGQIVEDISF